MRTKRMHLHVRWKEKVRVCNIALLGVQCFEISVCLSVCPLAYHVQTSWNFLYMLPVAVTRSAAHDSAIRYVFLLSWMTSRVYIMRPLLNQRRHCFVEFAGWRHQGRSLRLPCFVSLTGLVFRNYSRMDRERLGFVNEIFYKPDCSSVSEVPYF